MTKHFNPHGAGMLPFERKDADGAPSLVEIKGLVEAGNKAVAELKSETDAKIHGAVGKIRGEVDTLVDEKLAKANAEIKTLGDALNAVVAKANRPALGKDGEEKSADRVAYEKAFGAWFRKGTEPESLRDMERKAMSVGDDTAGGYTVIPEMDQAITNVLIQVSPMRSLASVQTIGSSSLKKMVNQRGTSSGWVGETETRSATNNAVLSELEFPVHEIYAMPTATQTLLDDSFLNIESWVAGEVSTEFAYQEGVAFITGDGVKKPRGVISGYSPVANASYAWGRPGFVGTGASAAFSATPADDLVSLYYALKSDYRGGASWIMNSATMATVRKIKDASGQYYILSDSFSANDGMVTQIMGHKVTEMQAMADIAANSYSIAFGDWARSYLIVDRMGTRMLRDPYTTRPYVNFYTTKRVGGGVQNFETFKLLKFI